MISRARRGLAPPLYVGRSRVPANHCSSRREETLFKNECVSRPRLLRQSVSLAATSNRHLTPTLAPFEAEREKTPRFRHRYVGMSARCTGTSPASSGFPPRPFAKLRHAWEPSPRRDQHSGSRARPSTCRFFPVTGRRTSSVSMPSIPGGGGERTVQANLKTPLRRVGAIVGFQPPRARSSFVNRSRLRSETALSLARPGGRFRRRRE